MDWESALKLFLAMVLGGFIGLERESGSRPAGFRTHTLVCMGAALVMLISEHLYRVYQFEGFPDPARLGANVLTGIGFLGAGTIMKDGSRVRGLTTAASLWVVACIGLAIGAGFYWGAVVAFVFSYIILVVFKKVEGLFFKEPLKTDIHLEIMNVPGQVASICKLLADFGIRIRDIKVLPGDDEWARAYFKVQMPPNLPMAAVMTELAHLDGVDINEE